MRAAVMMALAAVVACVPACGKKDSGKVKIGVVTNCAADFWKICEAGSRKAEAEFNIDLQFREPDKAFDASVQMPIVEAWAKQGVGGIAVSVIDPQGQTEDLKRIAKTVPLITMDNDADQSGRLCYIGIDNYEAGKAAGRLVKKALPNGGVVAVFIGSTKSANGKARTQGVLDELSGTKDATGADATYPAKPELKVKKFGTYYVVDGIAQEDGAPTNAAAKASAVYGRVKGLPDVCLVGLYAYNAPAILEVLGADASVKVVSFDEDWNTLKGIAEGRILGTVVQDPFAYGYESVKALATKKYDVPKIPYRVVTKDGGPAETVSGVEVQNLKAADFEAKLRADLASVKK